jgi:hypothetical protein
MDVRERVGTGADIVRLARLLLAAVAGNRSADEFDMSQDLSSLALQW